MIAYRQVIEDDIPALVEIGSADGRLASGIDGDSLLARLRNDHSGWVACSDGSPVGFAMANHTNGELWILAALREHEGVRGELMRQAEAWLFSHGWKEIRLATQGNEPDLAFFQEVGWADWKIEARQFLKKTNPRSVFKLEEHVVADSPTGYQRLVRLQRGPAGQPHRLCLFLDGEHYWRDMDTVPLLNALMEREEIPVMTLAFVGHVSGEARQQDYTCNELYGRFISGSIMEWLKKEVPDLREAGHLIAGLSLSGLMAVCQTLNSPRQFKYCLSQSGSHWWQPEGFEKMARQRAPVKARFWLSVGDQETETHVWHSPALFQEISQIAGVERAARILEEIGGTVHYHQYSGGHSLRCWQAGLGEALCWLLKDDP